MKIFLLVSLVFCLADYNLFSQTNHEIIADHNIAKLSFIPDEWIDSAKQKLHIAYGHTSHGSQLITGMNGLEDWKGEKFAWNNGGTNGALDLHDNAFSGASDLGNPNRTAWESATRNYLNNSSNSDVNVVVWSWCGQVSNAAEEDINTYLNLMTGLENDFPNVKFVYMTGHLDGSGVEGILNQRNEQIRNYCKNNDKILFDFADIESYDPDGNYYLDKGANDNCDYDSDDNGSRDKNWAEDWQNTHQENTDWYSCSAAHSQALNGNLKAYAAWWLWANLAGMQSLVSNLNEPGNKISFQLYQNYPNPFNPNTKIKYSFPVLSPLPEGAGGGLVILKIYNVLGNEVATLVNEYKPAGIYEVEWNADDFASGIYFYTITNGNYKQTKKMILLR